MRNTIVIDFGTSRTKLAYFDAATGKVDVMRLGHDERPYVPSYFHLSSAGHRFGDEAAEFLETDPGGFFDKPLKRQLREEWVRAENRLKATPVELLTLMFRQLRDRSRELANFVDQYPERLVLTVPAQSAHADREILARAATAAGFERDNVSFIEEPVAAAQAWLGEFHGDARDVLLLDCGGGTLDWALLRRTTADRFELVPELPPGGDNRVGGVDLDDALFQMVEDMLPDDEARLLLQDRLSLMRDRIRKVKEKYSRTGIGGVIKVGAATVELSPELIQATIDRRFNEHAARNIKDYQGKARKLPGIDKLTILLVGGSARLRGLKDAVQNACGVPVVWWERSEFATVRGALMAGATAEPAQPRPVALARSTSGQGSSGRQAGCVADDLDEGRGVHGSIQDELVKELKAIFETTTNSGISQRISIEMVDACEKAAQGGDVESQYILSGCYLYGIRRPQDKQAAFVWLHKVAEKGDAAAQTNLGCFYAEGTGVEKNMEASVLWWRKAAEQGFASAQCNLGDCYFLGDGVATDKQQAVEWYCKSAAQGNANAQYNLGLCYSGGGGVAADQYQAAIWYRKAADQGLAQAQNSLGFCYDNGHGVEKDKIQAVTWFRKAAEQGDARAQYNLGLCYVDGNAVITKDIAMAVAWFRKAAEHGLCEAQYNLGVCYDNGYGVDIDKVQAALWFRKAAEQEDADAQFAIAECYAAGAGVMHDLTKAVAWHAKSMRNGNVLARTQVAYMRRMALAMPLCFTRAFTILKRASVHVCKERSQYAKSCSQGDASMIEPTSAAKSLTKGCSADVGTSATSQNANVQRSSSRSTKNGMAGAAGGFLVGGPLGALIGGVGGAIIDYLIEKDKL